jgi:hypothetical protein
MKKQLFAIGVLLSVMGQMQGSVELKLPSGSWLKQCHSHHYQHTNNGYQLWAQCYNNKEKTESNPTLVNIDHTKAILTVDVGGQNNNQLLVKYSDGTVGYDKTIEETKTGLERTIERAKQQIKKKNHPKRQKRLDDAKKQLTELMAQANKTPTQ